jgi:hypothetical protein
MRKLILIATDGYVRNVVSSGAFDEIEDADTFYVASERVRQVGELESRGNLLPPITESKQRQSVYAQLQRLLLASYRSRSHTMAHKLELMARRRRWLYKVAALPLLSALVKRILLWRTGRNAELHSLLQRLRPDIVIAPSGGIDPLVTDLVRSARSLHIKSLVIAHNWDNVSSKGAFPVEPDCLAVWGPQSAEQARSIHRVPASKVRVLGAPSLDPYFRHEPGSSEPRFAFRHALFAGCYAPFDELQALELLEETIERERLDIKIVYRPHPHRRSRRRPDYFDERRFRHVVLDPELRDLYERAFQSFPEDPSRKPILPPLGSYPSLFEHCEFVLCPLSTMIVEAAIFERRVIVVAYDDEIHPNSPAAVLNYDHFAGIDRIEGFEICRRREDLPRLFLELANGSLESDLKPSLREQIRYWLHYDERTYSERLKDVVDELHGDAADRKSGPAERALSGRAVPARIPDDS